MMDSERVIRIETDIPAGAGDVWKAWTTREGLESFLAPVCKIDLRPGGVFEIHFLPESESGFRGSEGCTILAVDPGKMLSFTWNAPPGMPDIRRQYTHVTLRFRPLSETKTRVVLIHDGWGEGEAWDKAFTYFLHAWGTVVSGHLLRRFTTGPLEWND